MSIQSEIDRINQAKTDLAAAIESKGVIVPPNTTINVYPGLVQQIEQGAGLPSGGTPGQMLYQGESGAEWGDKPVMYVTVTLESGSSYGTSSKYSEEIYQAVLDGYAVYAVITNSSSVWIIPLLQSDSNLAYFSCMQEGILTIISIAKTVVGIYSAQLSSDLVSFTPGTTGLTAKNVQDAIEEVNAKIPSTPKSVTVTLPASGWSNNAQTVTVQGVKTSGQSVRISPATKTDADNWVAAGVWCSEPTTANQLVFTCDTAPTENININVELQEVQS